MKQQQETPEPASPMDTEEFRVRGKQMVDYMCDYMRTLGERPVSAAVEPNYLRGLLPRQAPVEPEPWDDIMADVEAKIMPGITHWQHPRFHAYFPSGNSYPSILGDMLSDVIGCIGFSWAASPACTELETIVLDWLGKAINLPPSMLSDSKGGGVIQGSASECILVSMLAARTQALLRLHQQDSSVPEVSHLPKLVAYCSKEAHSCVEKAAIIALVQLRILEPDKHNSLRGEILREAIQEDVENGLVPFFVSAIIGSTASCSSDRLREIGPVAKEYGCWLHVDAAYAGSACICPEFQPLLRGVEHADSFNLNPNKWLLVNFDCSCLWVKDRAKLISALVPKYDPLYLKHEHELEVFDYRHWGIPLSRRFRALKLWFVLRTYGLSGLQRYIRNHVRLAKVFEALVRQDDRFEVLNEVKMGLVCFRLRGEGNAATADLLAHVNRSGRLHMIPATVDGKYIIRFCVVAQHASDDDIEHAWHVIEKIASSLRSPSPPASAFRIPTTPEGRKLRRQFSFTCVAAPGTASGPRPSLYDGATPVVLPEDADDVNVFDEVFETARNRLERS